MAEKVSVISFHNIESVMFASLTAAAAAAGWEMLGKFLLYTSLSISDKSILP